MPLDGQEIAELLQGRIGVGGGEVAEKVEIIWGKTRGDTPGMSFGCDQTGLAAACEELLKEEEADMKAFGQPLLGAFSLIVSRQNLAP